jgi:hypothetical protein
MKTWIEKFIKSFYKEKTTRISYRFLDGEKLDILARFVAREREIVNLELYDVTQYGLIGNEIWFDITPKKDIPPPPPPPKDPKEKINSDSPTRVTLN